MNINAQIPVHTLAFSTFGLLSKSRIGRLYGDSMFDFFLGTTMLFHTGANHFTFL